MSSTNRKQTTIVALLLAGTFIAILNQTLMITAIPPVMEEMNVTANSAQWLTTVFMLVNGIMILLARFYWSALPPDSFSFPRWGFLLLVHW